MGFDFLIYNGMDGMNISSMQKKAAILLATFGTVSLVSGHVIGQKSVPMVMTAKTIPEATVAVIDPESGTSSGGGNSDVNLGPGDIILFRFDYFPAINAQISGVNSWVTEYVPRNTEVVGVRFIDADGYTVEPHFPGRAEDTAGGNQTYTGMACSSGATLDPLTGGACTGDGNTTRSMYTGTIAQVHADTGIFYATASGLSGFLGGAAPNDTFRFPATSFITFLNGQSMSTAEPAYASTIASAIGAVSPYRAHDQWDFFMVRAFGSGPGGGSTTAFAGNGGGKLAPPFLYGSPVAGPDTYYKYVPTTTPQWNDTVGPWQRVQYPGSLIGTGCNIANSSTGCSPNSGASKVRRVLDASTRGTNLRPITPLPSDTRAVRLATGQTIVGQPAYAEIALRVLNTPIDPDMNTDADCVEIFGSTAAVDNGGNEIPWGFMVPSAACTLLKLKQDLTARHTGTDPLVDPPEFLFSTGDQIVYTISGKNLAVYEMRNAYIVFQWTDPQLQSPTGTGWTSGVPAGTGLTCATNACAYYSLGNLAPGAEYSVPLTMTAGGTGDTTVPKAIFYASNLTSNEGAGTSGTFTSQHLTVKTGVPVLDATLSLPYDPTAVSTPANSTVTLSGTLSNVGRGRLSSIGNLIFALPTGWSASGTVQFSCSDASSTSAIGCGGTCGTSSPTFNMGGYSLNPGVTCSYSLNVVVPTGTTANLYPIGLHVEQSVTSFGGASEVYFDHLVDVNVGQVRSVPPVLDCASVASNSSTISGTTVESTNATPRTYFNLIERGDIPSVTTGSPNDWSVTGFVDDNGLATDFGPIYGGLEVRATIQEVGELESEYSNICFAQHVPQCSDGLDNDGDGFTDFPADPGCLSPTDNNEADPCNDGIDNDGDGFIDFGSDPGCSSATDSSETSQCEDGVNNDGTEDALIDYPADPDCSSPADNSEQSDAICRDTLDNDDATGGTNDGLTDFGPSAYGPGATSDPGCQSAFDQNEVDPLPTPDDIRARLLVVFDTSGSMNWNTCNDTYTGGDGSTDLDALGNSCAGSDVTSAACPSSTTSSDTFANDSRIYKAKKGLSDVVSGFGEVEYGLMRFHQREMDFACSSTNASAQSGGWAGSGAVCSGDFNGGDLLVGFSQENQDDLLQWMDNKANAPSGALPAPGYDWELRGSGTTPIAGSLGTALTYLDDPTNGVAINDDYGACRPYAVILITDGQESCGGDPVAAAAALATATTPDYPVYVIGFSVADDLAVRDLNHIADAGDDGVPATMALANQYWERTQCELATPGACDAVGLLPPPGYGSTTAIFVTDETSLSAAMSNIIADTVLVETCNGLDDNCNGLIDEGHTRYCDPSSGCTFDTDGYCVRETDGTGHPVGANTCFSPGETCNGLDDDCDDTIDEGVLNACGECGPVPTEICDGIDNDCDGAIDEGPAGEPNGACQSCTAEICDGADNDCDGSIDESWPLSCGVNVGQCTTGLIECVETTPGAADWHLTTCSGVQPSTETCDNVDNDCDGVIDGFTRPCDTTGITDPICQAGIQLCSAGGWGSCNGQVLGTTEVCNNFDDDCDGCVDEAADDPGPGCGGSVCSLSTEVCDGADNDGDGLIDAADPDLTGFGGDCPSALNLCGGTWQCVGGIAQCVGGKLITPEVCDCSDNDCDGTIDEEPTTGSLCPGVTPTGPAVCLTGPGGTGAGYACECAAPCGSSEFSKCPAGRVPVADPQGQTGCFCLTPNCDPVECATRTLMDLSTSSARCAPTGDLLSPCTCKNDVCTDSCDGVLCLSSQACDPRDGRCVVDDCRGLGCPSGQICDVGTLSCIDHPCNTAGCSADQVCRDGVCEDSCAGVACTSGQTCHSGLCQDDLCAGVTCTSGQYCDGTTGTCADSACLGVSCTDVEVCDPATGACVEDPCLKVVCPAGQACQAGECGVSTSANPDAGPERHILAAGGGGCTCRTAAPTDTPRGVWLFLAVLGITLFLRRRRHS